MSGYLLASPEELVLVAKRLMFAREGNRALDVVVHLVLYRNRIAPEALEHGYTMDDQGDSVKNSRLARSQYITKERGPSPHYSTNLQTAFRMIDPAWDFSIARLD